MTTDDRDGFPFTFDPDRDDFSFSDCQHAPAPGPDDLWPADDLMPSGELRPSGYNTPRHAANEE